MTLSSAKVLLVDDNKAVCEALRWALEEALGFYVVGEARDGNDALRLAAQTQPDIVILDIVLPHKNGYEVARLLKALPHPPLIFFLSIHTAPSFRQQATAAGGDAFVEKALGWPVLIAQLRSAMHQKEIQTTNADTSDIS